MVETPAPGSEPGSGLPPGLDLTPLDRYEPSRAKVCASVMWLLQRARGGAEPVPEELQDPLYTDQLGQEHLKPALSHLLLSPQLYTRAAPGGHGGAPADTPALLQLLIKKGISVRTDEGEVTEKELSHAPIRLKAHLALMDGLMALAAQDTLGQVKMAADAEAGAGAPWENALLFWVNRINQTLRESTEEEEQATKPPNCTDVQPQDPSQSSRWYWKLVPIRYRKDKVQSKLTPTFPLVSGLKDLSNGCAMGALLHFYCPGLLPLEDVCLKDTMSVADSVYNLQLIRAFCETHLQKCCPLQVEDLLYAPPLLHTNILVFLSELMDYFEIKKPDFVKPVQPIDLTDVSGVLDCTSPVSGHTSNSPAYIFKQPFVPIPSEVSADNQSWAKKQISGPLSAVAFSIPFGLDSDVDIVMGNPIDCVFRPVSSDGLAPAVPAMTSPVNAYSPPEDLSHLISSSAPTPRAWGPYMTPLGELPTIEEALQVAHPRKKRPEPRLRPEGAPAGFYLHSPEKESPALSSSVPSRGAGRDRKDRGRSSDMSRDDDSVLRDGSVDSSEASDDTPRNTPGNIRPNWGRQSVPVHSPNGNPRMTSFAERRDSRRRQPAAPGEEASSAPTTPGSPAVAPGRQDDAGTPGPEALALGARLEEKRKSIEAQKRRIEAIFAKHRQRLGKTAFLQLQREQAEGGADTAATTEGDTDQLSLDERLTQVEEQLQRDEEREQKENVSATPPRLEKQVTFSLDNKDREGGPSSSGPGPGVQEYTEVVQKLSEALECLQKDMKKLTQQQQQLLSGQWPRTMPKNSPKNKLPPTTSKTPPRTPTKTPTRSVSKALLIPTAPSASLRSSGSPLSSSCPAPRTRTTTTPRSPKAHSRPHVHHPRPSELKFPPLTRVLTPPQSVDSLPHLRRVSPSKCQVQTSSSFRIGGPKTPQESPQTAVPQQPEESTSDTGSSETPTQFSLELDQEERSSTQDIQQPTAESSPSACSLQSETLSLSAFSVGPEGPAGDRCSLMASLSSLGVAEGGCDEHTDETQEFSSDSMSDLTDAAVAGAQEQECGPPLSESSVEEPQQSESSAEGPAEPPISETSGDLNDSGLRGGIGFFYMDEAHREEDMAQRRAALLERQQRRSEELRRRRQWHEPDPENRLGGAEQRAASPSGSPAGRTSSSPTPPATPARRGDFTRGEYAWRQQLRIMNDLDKMLKQKSNPPGRASVKKTRARPRSMTREGTQLSLSPAKSTPGPRLTKVYSHSSLNLPATGDTGNSSSEPKKPQSRPDSPCRQGKDSEPGSSGSSSAPDYTGPKLFKEPSFKSNKFIIHNALSRCCLAGKVNEAQKNKIVEEMEKSAANHFLILFRDSSCQFRGVYTLSPDAQELVRLTGVGPRAVSCAQVESIYKYSSDRKQFCPIPSKTLGMSVDAFTIPGPLWQGGGAGGGAGRRASVTKKSASAK